MFSAVVSMHSQHSNILAAISSFGLPNDGSVRDDELEVCNVARSDFLACFERK